MLRQHPHQRGRTKQLGHAEALDGIVQACRVGLRRPRRVHVRDHRGQAQRRVEQGKRREGRQVHPARFHAEGTAQQLDLADEMAVAVDHALGHAGGATGEQDRGHVLAIGVGQHRPSAGAGALQRGRLVPPQPRRRPTVTVRVAEGAQRSASRATCASGMPMKACGCASSEHCFRARLSMPGSTSTGTAPSEQREHQQEEFRRGPHHHHRAHPAADPVAGQTGGHGVAAGIQLAVIEGDVVGGHAVAGASAARAADGDLVGAFTRQFRQARGNVAGSVHLFIVAAYGISCAAADFVENPHPRSRFRLPPEAACPCNIPA